MSERVIRQRNIIHALKIEKQRRQEAQQAMEAAPRPSRRVLQQRENARMRRAGRRTLREAVRNPLARRCRYCLHDDCEPHSKRSSRKCHAHIFSINEIMENILGPDHQIRDKEAEDKEGYCQKKDGIDVPSQVILQARNKDKEVLFKIAKIYYHGRKSDIKAFAWFHKAALQDHGTSQALVGWMYKSGTGVARDYKLAMEWYLRAAAQDDFDAPSNIGILYQYGLGVPIDYKKAMKWYMIAANKDHPYALNNVGNLHHGGFGVPKSVDNAIKCYTRAALLEEGGEGAQCNLAAIYESDAKYKGLQKAVNWYQKAADCDFDQAIKKAKCLNHRGYFAKHEQKDEEILDECNSVNKNTSKKQNQSFLTTNHNSKDDKMRDSQDSFHLKVNLLEKESVASKDALKRLCFILDQQKLQTSKAYREKLLYNICCGPSDESQDDQVSDYSE